MYHNKVNDAIALKYTWYQDLPFADHAWLYQHWGYVKNILVLSMLALIDNVFKDLSILIKSHITE